MNNEKVSVREIMEGPTEEYPDGSYVKMIGDKVVDAWGRFNPGYVSPYWDGKPPLQIINWAHESPWSKL